MKHIQHHIYLMIVIWSVLLTGCKTIEYMQQDDFYRSGSEWGTLRFPLIKPYFALYIGDEFGWTIRLHSGSTDSNIYYYTQLNNVQKISVEQKTIVVYTEYKQDLDKGLGEEVYYWFVLIPDQGIERGFNNEPSFLAYIQKYDLQQPLWRKPDDILKEYDETWCLDWIPTCN